MGEIYDAALRPAGLHGTQLNFFVALALLKAATITHLAKNRRWAGLVSWHDRFSLGNDGINQEVAVQGFPDEFAFSISGHS
jgi:hypothetical protein